METAERPYNLRATLTWMEYAKAALAGFCSDPTDTSEVSGAIIVADEMLSEHKKRWSK